MLYRGRDKGSGKAICATARKLLALIYVLLTQDLEYWSLEERLYQRKLRLLARAAQPWEARLA